MHNLRRISCWILTLFLASSSISLPRETVLGAETADTSTSYTAGEQSGTDAAETTEQSAEQGTTSTEQDTVSTEQDTASTEQGTTSTEQPTEADILTEADVVLDETAFTYDGTPKEPAVTVTKALSPLVLDTDYTISYSDNISAGTGKVTVTGIGRFTGTVTLDFTIAPKDLSGLALTLSDTAYTYSGEPKEPTVSVNDNDATLTADTDFTVSYKDNINKGTASVILTGAGNYTGKLTGSFTIKAKSLKKFKLTLDTTTYTYNGSKKKPVVTVKSGDLTLKKNTDYKVSYSNNKKPGVAKVTVKGKGNYSGTLTKSFNISPKRVNLYNIDHEGKKIILTWEKDKTVTGYQVCRKSSGGSWKVIKTLSGKTKSFTDHSTGSYGNSYKYRLRAYKTSGKKKVYGAYSKTLSAKVQNGAIKINAVTPDSKKAFVLSWTTQDSADGYYIYRRNNNSSKWKKIKTIPSGGTGTYTDSGLKYKKTYTYSVRAFHKNGTTIVKGKMDNTGFSAKLYFKSKYKNGYKFYYDAAGKLIRNVDHIIGKQDSYRLKVNKQANVVTVYAKDGDKGYTIPVKCFLCSCGGANTPVGTFSTPAKYRWHTLDHGVEGQWCTRIHDGVLFHSVWYYSRSKTDLTTVQYNRLGNTASAGCVRVNCESAKWIYDNCSLGTRVTIYTDSDPGPLGKPKATIIPSWHTWDPTDPTCTDLCRKKGCH